MKRSWIGLGMLVVLLAVSVAASWAMGRIHEPIEADLKQAAECAVLGDWENADHFFRQARDRWTKWEHFRGCLADHTPTEEVGAGFAALEVYCHIRDEVDFAAGCCELAEKAAAVGEAHGLVWWNVL